MADASPTLTTTANPTGAQTLGAAGSQILQDSAVLAASNNPTGTITFTLARNTTVVYTDV